MFACIHVIMAKRVMSSAEMSTKLASPAPIVHAVHRVQTTIQDCVVPVQRTQQITTWCACSTWTCQSTWCTWGWTWRMISERVLWTPCMLLETWPCILHMELVIWQWTLSIMLGMLLWTQYMVLVMWLSTQSIQSTSLSMMDFLLSVILSTQALILHFPHSLPTVEDDPEIICSEIPAKMKPKCNKILVHIVYVSFFNESGHLCIIYW